MRRAASPLLTRAAGAAALALFACAALGWLAPVHWFPELFSHFLPHSVAAALLLAALFALLRRARAALACAALALVQSVLVGYAHMLPPARATVDASADAITLVQFNVGTERADPRTVRAWLRDHPADIVVLFEVSGPAWEAVLDALRDRYPHQVRDLSAPPFGIALLTRLEPDAMRVHDDPSGPFPHATLAARSPVRGIPFTLWGVHPPPPLGRDWARARDAQLLAIAQAAGALRGRVAIVAGDFNVTPWAPTYRAMLARGLADARALHPWQNTWPARPGARIWGIAIDHTLVSSGARIEARRIGPSLGSDHHAVTSRIGFAGPPG